MICKISSLLKLEILGLFLKALTARDKYAVRDCENLQFPIQMQLFLKWKTFSRVFVPLMESPSNFKHFRPKDDRDS